MKNPQINEFTGVLPLPGFAARARKERTVKLSVLNRDRSVPHLERKFYHLLNGIICFFLYAFVFDRVEALWVLGIIGGAMLACDILRLRNAKFNNLVLRVCGKVMRREEVKSLTANSFYALGLFVVVWVFPKPIALMSVLFLAFGDPVAAVVGTLYGKHKLIAKKSLEGSLANFGVCLFATLALALLYFGLSWDRSMTLALVGGSASMIAELLPLPVDDNFTIPVFSAIQVFCVSQVTLLF